MNSPKKVRVAFFTDILTKDLDGAIKTMYQLIDRIPEEEFEFLFFCGTPPNHKIKHRVISVPTVTLFFNCTYKIAVPLLSGAKLTKELSEFNPDIIHISTPSFLGFFALNYANKNQIPVLTIYHTHFISYLKYYLKLMPFLIKPAEFIAKKLYRTFYNKCSTIYTPTIQMVTELKEMGISGKLLKVWQRGIDTNLFNPSKKDTGFMKSIAGNDKPCILFASRLVWEKNIETLFTIYDEAQAQQLDVNFIVTGVGVAEQVARQRMKKAIFLGFIDHSTLAKIFASSDIFLFPSISETYGNVVVEAMACGCTPVIARGGGSQSLVMDGKTGFLCEPTNAKEYIRKIDTVLQDSTLKEKMKMSGLQYTSTLKWQTLANNYFEDIICLALNYRYKKHLMPSYHDSAAVQFKSKVLSYLLQK
ncbi:MAG: glycosyltransferase family 1 protein [Paludibacter sp.]|nr:glycosyltransferase family 1 protein [Paludibacter sp.]